MKEQLRPKIFLRIKRILHINKIKIYQKDVIIIYVPNNLASKYIKQELIENKRKFTNQHTRIF